MTKYSNILETIGKTPLVKINKLSKNKNLYAKIEFYNPAGSIKDRVALSMIEKAEKDNLIKAGETTLIEPTSGNTGIGLALVSAIKGYRLILTMPETMSIERRKLLKAYGAEVILTEGQKGMQGAIDKAEEIHKAIKDSYILQQFKNPANFIAHYKETGKEIWEDTNGDIDIFVTGVGTGGTLTGIGKYLKEKNKNIKIIAIEPKNNAILTKGTLGQHGIQGIGAGFVPEILDTSIIDKVVTVTEEEAIKTARLIAKKEGLLVGISAGANLYVAAQIANDNPDKTIVTIIPDSGERYLSGILFE